ncbi:MAG: TMEM165/GDT1 family protein [bacterium]
MMAFWPLIVSFLVIGIAELGDKTQLLAIGLATRFPLGVVIFGILAATALLNGLAVIFGGIVYQLVPHYFLQLIAGLMFIGFGVWTIFSEQKENIKPGANKDRSSFLFIVSAFFLAELGDKTQLAVMALAAKYGTPFQVWLGATLGMGGINIVAILASILLKRHIPEEKLRWVGAVIFILFGLFSLLELALR